MQCQHDTNGPNAPQKAEALDAPHVEGPIDQNQHHDSDSARVESKALLTLQARTALWGGVLTATEGDDGRPLYIVTRWALTRSFESVADVEGWLRKVGAAP